MKISAKEFTDGQKIPAQLTCDGQNTPPTLSITGVPAGTKSLALIVHDPDAVRGDWTHWLVWNLPPETETVGAVLPADAKEGTTDFGKPGYGGPCPPSGSHRYLFEIYALDSTIDLGQQSKREELEIEMTGHILEKAVLTGIYR